MAKHKKYAGTCAGSLNVESSSIVHKQGDIMKRIGYLYEKIYDMENLKLAHKNASKGKGWYKEVCMVDADSEYYLNILQEQLIKQSYNTSDYVIFERTEGKKVREIYKLPYFPDRICQWALLQVIEPVLMKQLVRDTYSAIPGRGIHLALNRITIIIKEDREGTKYCLKLDVKKYYPNINHAILKSIYRKIFKDDKLLWLIDEIIDSTEGEKGIPIGNYLSQWSGNLYLSPFDHWIKEVKGVKYYYRYMDDMVILYESKEFLHNLKNEIEEFLMTELNLELKDNWQVFPSAIRGIDFLGYRIFPDFVLLRKSTVKKLKSRVREVNKYLKTHDRMTHNQWCSLNSYNGWLLYCNSYRLQQKYIIPLIVAMEKFYKEVIQNEGKRNTGVREAIRAG